MVTGTEKFGYIPLNGQQPSIAYNEEKDVALYAIPEEDLSYIRLSPGQFIIFFPTDIHQPEVYNKAPELVKKLVLKISVT